MSIDVKRRDTENDTVSYTDLEVNDTFEYNGRCYMVIVVPNFDEDEDVQMSLDLATGELCKKMIAYVRKVDFVLHEKKPVILESS